MHNKAQTSFETILLATAIIMLAIVSVGYFNSIKNPTLAMGIAKTNTLKALNAIQEPEKNFIIKQISFTEDLAANSITLNILTDNSNLECTDIDYQGTKDLIQNQGLYTNVTIILNNSKTC